MRFNGKDRAYHLDSGAKGSLAGGGSQGLKTGEVLNRSAIGAQKTTATERGGGESDGSAGNCGGSRSSRCSMCQGGHRAHRGSGSVGRCQHDDRLLDLFIITRVSHCVWLANQWCHFLGNNSHPVEDVCKGLVVLYLSKINKIRRQI